MIQVKLYLNSRANNYVDKTTGLSNELTINCELNESSNLLSPTLIIDVRGLSGVGDNIMSNYNYLYIPSYHRYYYITNTTWMVDSIYKIETKVDVLMSYKTSIKNQTAFVSRQENNYDNNIRDNLQSYTEKTTFEVVNCNILDSTMNWNLDKLNRWGVVLSVETIKASLYPFYNDIIPNGVGYGDSGYDGSVLEDIYYVMRPYEAEKVLALLKENENYLTLIKAFFYVPFDLDMAGYYEDPEDESSWRYYETNQLFIGDESVILPVNVRFSKENSFHNYGLYTISGFNIPDDYVHRQADYYIYLNFLGLKKFSYDDLMANSNTGFIRIEAYFQKSTGRSWYVIRNSLRIIETGECNLCVDIELTNVNSRAIQDQKTNLAVSTALGSIASIASIGIGIGTGNPLGVIGGVLGASKTLTEAVVQSNQLHMRGNFSYTDSIEARHNFIGGNKLLYCQYKTPTESINASLFGKPCYKMLSLGSVSGYTIIERINLSFTSENPTKTEIDEIVALLKGGVYF